MKAYARTISAADVLGEPRCRGLSHGGGGCGPVRYWWTCLPSRNVVGLCVECCAAWRLNAAKDPSLRPESIEERRSGHTCEERS